MLQTKWMWLFIIIFQTLLFAGETVQLRLITVTGDAEVKVVPDEVVLTLGIETWNKDLALAKAENDERVKTVIAITTKHDVEEKHVQTDFINIEPRYEQAWEHKKFIGYFVQKSVVITLKDISQFEGLLSAVLEQGANYVHGIQFRTTELRKHRDHARALAIKAAREKAVALASELEQTVGKPHSIQETPVGWWSGYHSGWGGRYGNAMSQNVVQNAGGASDMNSSLAPGQITVKAQVTVSFEIE